VVEEQPHQVTMSPWPFRENEVTLVYEGRLLQETFTSETAMRESLMSDCWVTLNTTVKPE